MKNIKTIITGLALISLLTECKKGEDDPLISFRSRKARVVGEWTMKSGSSSYSSSYNNTSNSSNTIYTETGYSESNTSVYNNVSTTTSTAGTHTLKMEYEKDGKFTFTETQDGEVVTGTGTWNFTGKIGENKNKEQLVLHFNSINGSGFISTYSGNQTDITYNIKELRNKKMVLSSESGQTMTGSTDFSKTEYELEQ